MIISQLMIRRPSHALIALDESRSTYTREEVVCLGLLPQEQEFQI